MAAIPSAQAFNLYLNWVIYAVEGSLGSADSLMSRFPAEIESIAALLRAIMPLELPKLYRGLLLEPHEAASGFLQKDPRVTFVSFSESQQVACWFADPQSIVGGSLYEQRPNVEGYIVKRRPKLSEVLSHHRWLRSFPLPDRSGKKLIRLDLAVEAPRIVPPGGPNADQFAWNIQTQEEVIVKPFDEALKLVPRNFVGCPSTEELDQKLTYPPAYAAAQRGML
jgi:hypothetical protein